MIYDTLKKNKPLNMSLYADLEGCKVNGGTLPPEVILTTSRPDLVLIDKSCSPHQVIMIELTMTYDRATNIEAARNRKKARYEYLASDIESKGLNCSNRPLEVGVRGYISPSNRETLFFIAQICKVKRPGEFIKKIGKTALIGSYQIYLSRKSQEWSPGGLIIP